MASTTDGSATRLETSRVFVTAVIPWRCRLVVASKNFAIYRGVAPVYVWDERLSPLVGEISKIVALNVLVLSTVADGGLDVTGS